MVKLQEKESAKMFYYLVIERKKVFFFELPYWKTLKLRYNLDVMHIEKNVCDNVLGTLLNIKGKTKDNIYTRFDLECMVYDLSFMLLLQVMAGMCFALHVILCQLMKNEHFLSS